MGGAACCFGVAPPGFGLEGFADARRGKGGLTRQMPAPDSQCQNDGAKQRNGRHQPRAFIRRGAFDQGAHFHRRFYPLRPVYQRPVLEEIKADEILKRIPVIVMTTSKAEQDIYRAYNLNANCYVTKPVDLDEFLNVVRSIEDFWLTIVTLPND